MKNQNGREPSLPQGKDVSGREPYLGGDRKPRVCDLWLTLDGTILIGDPYLGVSVIVCCNRSLLIAPDTDSAFKAYVVSDDFRSHFILAETQYREALKKFQENNS